MRLRPLVMAGIFAAAVSAPIAAEAAIGHATGYVNLRTGPSTAYGVITVIPAGAPVNIYSCRSWCQVAYNGVSGWASASYIAGGGYAYRPPVVAQPPMMHRPPPPMWGYYQRPWWDSRRQAWYDGRRWYMNGRWYDKPSGFSFGFGFSG